MNQRERREYLIHYLIQEQQLKDIQIPDKEIEQKHLLRALFNIRMPGTADQKFLKIQDTYLQEETKQKGITHFSDLVPIQKDIYLWQGDITTLDCDAIVNAANSQLLGCFYPNHGCIDNAIHTYSGIQLRLACANIMKKQGYEEPTGKAKITPAFNLPCKYVIHTVGPIIQGLLTKKSIDLLASCYRTCLELADSYQLQNIAFCCISTGEFHFPNETAAKIAIQSVKEYKTRTNSKLEVIFNVFKTNDYNIYKELLQSDR